ncbi:hypothetical protein BJ912DRAFT_920438 [Pholiota molesta]|nr:hypothetical protein BJ912DRAFT_920438 [Pholiota molesta]
MADKSSETDKEPRTPSATAETDPESRPPSPFPDPFDLAIPRGFDSFADGNGNRYLVPPYLNGPTEQLVQRHIAAVKDWKDIPHTKHDVGDAVWSDGIMLLTGLPNDVCRCHNAASSESKSSHGTWLRTTGGGDVDYPPDPIPTHREGVELHHEVVIMQSLYGLSYKDAAHRLYLNEVATLRAYADMRNAVSTLQTKVKQAISADIIAPVVHLESFRTLDDPQPKPDDSLPYHKEGDLDSM